LVTSLFRYKQGYTVRSMW